MTKTAERASISADWRRAWLVVLAATIGYGTGGAIVQLTASLFIVPMREDLGWSTTAVTFAPIITLVWGLCAPLAGAFVDRLGGRRTALIGMVGVAFSTALLAVVPISQLSLYAIAAIIGVFSALTSTPPFSRVIATWFSSGIGLPLGITLSGSAIVAMVALPLVSSVIGTHGWRAGFLADAMITLLIGIPVVLLGCRERRVEPALEQVAGGDPAGRAGVTVLQALRGSVFWCYFVSFALGCIPLGGFLSHLQPLLRGQDFAVGTAVELGIIFAVSVTFGRVVGGFLLDRIWPFAVGAAFLTLAAGGAFAAAYLTGESSFMVAAAILWLIGMGQGAEADFIAFFSLRSFGMRSFGKIVGLMAVVATANVSVGAFGFGRIVDLYGSYRYACYIGAACWLASALLLVVAGIRERRAGLAAT